MDYQVKPGDVVELKSGGPSMTVVSVDENGKVEATWYRGRDQDYVRSWFEPFLLKDGG